MSNRAPLVFSASVVGLLLATSPAFSLGLPIFTTAPADISIVNEFMSGVPSEFYSFTLETTIASAPGTPEFVGQTFSMRFSSLPLLGPGGGGSFSIAGLPGVLAEFGSPNGAGEGRAFVNPPEEFACDPAGNCIIQYVGLYNAFNTRARETPGSDSLGSEILNYKLNFALPIATGYEYCFDSSVSDCFFSTVEGLIESGGRPVTENFAYSYVEGRVRNATITFSTVGGPTPSPVPIPAAGLLFAAALPTLALVKRRRAKKRNQAVSG
jgi:hypothetical protein